jgi:hypothetical protein
MIFDASGCIGHLPYIRTPKQPSCGDPNFLRLLLLVLLYCLIDWPRIPASAYFLLQSSHLLFQAFDAIERIVEAGGLQRLQEGADGRESAAKFPLRWDRMAR